jgi:hypothetical protein
MGVACASIYTILQSASKEHATAEVWDRVGGWRGRRVGEGGEGSLLHSHRPPQLFTGARHRAHL